jgi:hypothetical protein
LRRTIRARKRHDPCASDPRPQRKVRFGSATNSLSAMCALLPGRGVDVRAGGRLPRSRWPSLVDGPQRRKQLVEGTNGRREQPLAGRPHRAPARPRHRAGALRRSAGRRARGRRGQGARRARRALRRRPPRRRLAEGQAPPHARPRRPRRRVGPRPAEQPAPRRAGGRRRRLRDARQDLQAFDGVQTSPRYPGGVALRFARVLRDREDKTAAEADDLAAVPAIGAGRHRRRISPRPPRADTRAPRRRGTLQLCRAKPKPEVCAVPSEP